MCGFCGFTGNKISDKKTVINRMTDKIKHRGPDGEGYHIDDKVTLGFRRLSFLDLKQGNQPIYNEDKTLAIVFNGEIYNFRSLKTTLETKGHIFTTNSDTEVILHLYEEYKEALMEHLRGMFAFVIYEIPTGKVFAARDYFGIKPFYYAQIEKEFVFASEIKSFLEYPFFQKEVNPDALENYLTFQYSVLDETFFSGVYKLLPGHYLIYDGETKEIEIRKYFSIEFAPKKQTLTEAVEAIDKAIGDSVEHHKVSDVEIGSFLSSGVDSSLVAARFNWNKTFTVGFDYEDYNEIGYAETLSKSAGLSNYSKIITTEEYWDALGKIQYHMDEPLADPSAVALYFVSQMAKNHVKGVLSGEGADELFGGYNIYREPMALKPIQILPRALRKTLAELAKKLPAFKGRNYIIRSSQSLEKRFLGNAKIFTEKERAKLLKSKGTTKIQDITRPLYKKASHYDQITKMQFIDLHLWLVGDILLKADKMSMAHGLEVRVPYLDKEVYKVAMALPTEFRVNKKATKYAFRLSAEKHISSAAAAKKKLGFPVPIRIWLKEDKYYNIIQNAFTSGAAENFFDTERLLELLDNHKEGKEDNSRKIWTLYMFLVWYKEYFEN